MATTPNERYLIKGVALGETVKYLSPNLFFVGLIDGNGNAVGGNPIIPAIRDTTDGIAYLKYDYSMSNDPKRGTPPERVSGTRFPRIDSTRPTLATDVMKSNGFELAIPRSVLRASSAGSAEEIRTQFETAAYWIGKLLNSEIPTAMAAGANTTTSLFSPAAEWSDTSASNPLKDLRNFKRDYEYDDQPFTLTDVLINKTNFWELEDAIIDTDYTDMQRREFAGTPKKINGEKINIPTIGDVHNVRSDITESYLMGLDRFHAAAEYHYYVDEKYSMEKISYDAKIDGQIKRVKVFNPGIHYKTFEDNDSEDQIMRFWIEGRTIVKRPYGILYTSGI